MEKKNIFNREWKKDGKRMEIGWKENGKRIRRMEGGCKKGGRSMEVGWKKDVRRIE